MACPGRLLRGEWAALGECWPGGGEGKAALLAKQEHARGAGSVMTCVPLLPPPLFLLHLWEATSHNLCPYTYFVFRGYSSPARKGATTFIPLCPAQGQRKYRLLFLTVDSPRNVMDSGSELCWALALGVAGQRGQAWSLRCWGCLLARGFGWEGVWEPSPVMCPLPKPRDPSHQEKLLFPPLPHWHEGVSCHCSLHVSHSCWSPMCLS